VRTSWCTTWTNNYRKERAIFHRSFLSPVFFGNGYLHPYMGVASRSSPGNSFSFDWRCNITGGNLVCRASRVVAKIDEKETARGGRSTTTMHPSRRRCGYKLTEKSPRDVGLIALAIRRGKPREIPLELFDTHRSFVSLRFELGVVRIRTHENSRIRLLFIRNLVIGTFAISSSGKFEACLPK